MVAQPMRCPGEVRWQGNFRGGGKAYWVESCDDQRQGLGCPTAPFRRLVKAGRLSEEAERVASRVEHHPNPGLGLKLSQASAALQGPRDARLQILDGDVKVHHHLLLATRRGPDWRGIVLLVREGQSGWKHLHCPSCSGLSVSESSA